MRDRDLIRSYWPVELRPAFDALFAIDDAMADVVVRATQPALAAIKLAWWRERLEELDEGKVPAEPRLQQAANELLPRRVTGKMLAGLEDGWAALLEEPPDVLRGELRGAQLFAIGSRLLGVDYSLEVEGRLFAKMELRRRGFSIAAHEVASQTIPRKARPITALAALAARDFRNDEFLEPEATPGRAWTLMRHRLTGRL